MEKKQKKDALFKVILWGFGNEYKKARETLHALHNSGKLQVLGITATNPPNELELDGWKVIRPEKLGKIECDRILIYNLSNYEEIITYCGRISGIQQQSLMYGGALSNEEDFEIYQMLSKSRISILSNNCWGGVMSHSLGLEHLSPTKNCWFYDDDYLKILKKPEHYLQQCDPVLYRWEPGGDEGQVRYPVLRLDDVQIFCNHDNDPDDAIQTWIRRRNRLNLDNVFVSFAPCTPEMEREFYNLNRYEKKLCLVPWEPQCPISIRVEKAPEEKRWIESIIRTARPCSFQKYYSPIRLLFNGELTASQTEEQRGGV